MSHNWKSTPLRSKEHTLHVLAELQGKQWLCRGHSIPSAGLAPSIDRAPREDLPRFKKLTLERQSINIFRSTARFFASPGEQHALRDDVGALMVLRHYGVPTRLLDWSNSPYVAAYFAVEEGNDAEDGQIWSFDGQRFGRDAQKKQWKKWPETTIDGSGVGDKFQAKLTAFTVKKPRSNWFTCFFYYPG